jgi:hypothetical protein
LLIEIEMNKYRIYIDEVGNPDVESSVNPNHRFLSLTGVIIELGYVAEKLQPQLESLKNKFFDSHPDSPVVLHRKELLNARAPFTKLRDSGTRQAFDAELLALLENWQYQVISVCIDKKAHKDTYSTWLYDPYHYCLTTLLERYIFFLDSIDCIGDVMAESRGGKEDMRLKDAFTNLYEKGTDYLSGDRIRKRLTSRKLKVKSKSNNIAGLQVADLLAHPSRNEILYENNLLGKELPPFGKMIVRILQKKYYRKATKFYGKKML